MIRASCRLQNLAEVQGLRRVVISLFSDVLQGIRWPQNMSSLQAIDNDKLDEHHKYDPDHLGFWHLPDEWQNYTSLKSLSLPFFHGEDLPDWFTQLQQLRQLCMPYARLLVFPPCFLQLQNLEHLDLENVEGFMHKDNVVGLAKLQHLTYLNFGSQPSRQGYQLNSLIQLCAALQTRDKPLQLKGCQHGAHHNVWTFVKI